MMLLSRQNCAVVVGASLLLAWFAARTLAADHSGDEFFERRIRPVLVDRCLECHGQQKQKGGLRLDSRGGWSKGGENGAAIVPGDANKSLLIRAIRYTDQDLQMPPRKKGGALPPQQVADFETWVKMGAPDPREGEAKLGGMTVAQARSWWAFAPLNAQVNESRPRSIDEFLQKDSPALANSPRADQRTLLRRVTYDLTGLPPTVAEMDAFLSDDSAEAYHKVVERLLASPAYGEKWGRYWLDVVRYADTAGENSDRPLPEAWRYRNWVIDALNRDLPYDQFIREQIAGDLLAAQGPAEDASQKIIATGYLAVARRFGHEIEKDMHLTFEDTLDTMGKSVLGMTIGCARCHDHKYDPISTRDYYGLYGILQSTRFPFTGCEPQPLPRDLVPIPSPQTKKRLAEWEREMGAAERGLEQAKSLHAQEKDAAKMTAAAKRARDEVAAHKPAMELAFAVAEGKPVNAHIQKKGEPKDLGDEVPRKMLDVLGGRIISPAEGSGRLQLADWLVRGPARDLAARVMVNRIWAGHFGTGIVATPNDFGSRGAPPSNPALLDYLAAQFIEHGWSMKAVHRMMVESAAYQRRDFPRRRLTAEELRDTLLMAGGRLDRTSGGPHPFPPPSQWHYTQHAPFSAVYESNHRSVYLMVQRTRRHPFLALFDGADPNMSTPVRSQSIVPTQALYFLNDPFVHAQAKAMAERLMTAAPDDLSRLDLATRTLFGRRATEEEKQMIAPFLAQTSVEISNVKPADRAAAGWAAWIRVLFSTNELMYVD